ncbi:MAG: hypothetical protein WC665_11660 [Sulfurimonas sp.]|jgi:hypothetical protein
MYDIKEKISAVDTFPDDDKIRIVYAYGALIQNINSTKVPNVEVLLKEIVDNQTTDNVIIIKISIAQIDIVRLFTVWKGRKRTVKYWTDFEQYKCNQKFSFDFDVCAPESIKYEDKHQDSGYPYFSPYWYELRHITKDHGYHFHFNNSRYTKLTTNDGIIVLISSFEILTSTYVPYEQHIRNQLLGFPIEKILSEYIDDKSTFIHNDEYHMQFYNNKDNANISFLSYLKFNQITKQRLTRLRSSMETGSKYSDRYPVVLPYHPKIMEIVSDGIWLDKKTFFVFRINGYSLPEEYKIIVQETENTANIEKPIDGGQTSNWKTNPPDIDNYEIPINNIERPHNDNGAIRIMSEVIVLNREKCNIQHIVKKKEVESSNLLRRNRENEIEGLSSGEPSGSKDSKKTGGIIIDNPAKKIRLKQSETIELIEKALCNIVKDGIKFKESNGELKKLHFDNLLFVDEQCNLYQENPSSIFYNVLKHKSKNFGSWVIKKYKDETTGDYKYNYRSYMLVKIKLMDGRFAYLLEIDRRNDKEGFSGLIFNLNGSEISDISLNKLLSRIVENSGRYKRKIKNKKSENLDIPVNKHIVYGHEAVKNSILTKMENVIYQAYKDGIFLD